MEADRHVQREVYDGVDEPPTRTERRGSTPHHILRPRSGSSKNFHAAGGQSKQYAVTNTATEIKNTVAAAFDEFNLQNKENALTVNEVKEVRENIDTLQEAVALQAKAVACWEAVRRRARNGACERGGASNGTPHPLQNGPTRAHW